MPSLKDIQVTKLPDKVETENYTSTDINSTPVAIDKDFLKEKIENYASLKKSEDKMREFTVFHDKEFALDGNKITFTFNNETLKEQLQIVKISFQEYLKKELNQTFTVDSIVEEGEQKVMLYSQSDKYNFLAQQYPQLEELKKRLGLELEF